MTDAELAQRAIAGDAEAIADIYLRYHAFACRQARQMGAGARAEDAVQTLFLWLLEGRWRLQADWQAKTQTLHMFVKTLVRFAVWKLHEGDSTSPLRRSRRSSPVPSVTPEACCLAKERVSRLARAFVGLQPRLRRVARLRYLKELPGPDIAAAIGVKPETVPPYFALIRQHLRRELADVYDLPMPDAATRYQRIDPRYQHEAR